MIDKKEQSRLQEIVSKYYDFSSTQFSEDSISFRVPTFHLQPEQNFSKLTNELDALGFLTFTKQSDVDEIVIMEKPATRARDNNKIKLALFLATLLSMLYFGYTYQESYQGYSNPLGNLATSLLFYLLPLSVILIGREAAKYVALKRNGMHYTIPIFVPNPLGFGSMGTINTPNKPFLSKRAMVEAGSFSIITGSLLSSIFLVIGSLTTYNFPPSAPIVNSPVQTIGSPLIMQFIVNRIIPSNGILDPLALAGWSGIVITAFNALPLGFMDGGLIASAIFGRKASYLSYVSILVMVLLGLIYPPWYILLVFALLVGLRGPQPLNNITKLRLNTKVIAAVSFMIIIIGIAPFPFHTGLNTFTASASQEYFVAYTGHDSVQFNVTVYNTGLSTIVPAFEVSPSLNFQLSGESRSISPNTLFNYSMDLILPSTVHTGFSHYEITVYSGSYYKDLSITVMKVNTTLALAFNNNNPYKMVPDSNGSVSLNLTSSVSDTLHVVSMGGPNISFYYYPQMNNYSRLAYSGNMVYLLGSPSGSSASELTLDPGTPMPIHLKLNSHPSYWYVVAYDNHYNATIAEYKAHK